MFYPMNGRAKVSITMMVTIIPIITSGNPALKISLMLMYLVPYAIATVGSAIGSMKDKLHAIATGTA